MIFIEDVYAYKSKFEGNVSELYKIELIFILVLNTYYIQTLSYKL